MIDYAASKAALITPTKSVAVHLAERGVRANVVAPGPPWTPLNEADPHMPPDGLAHIGSEAPLERAAQPEEIAPTYVVSPPTPTSLHRLSRYRLAAARLP
ncbi:SDR family oxidoreductase [Streptomyces sp. NPDC093598]|uniref:SDR family oxidoreductase n=1 Tax=Streptomyces sp. NPDC093598 TaxID=3366046 RepID=UPI0037F82D18